MGIERVWPKFFKVGLTYLMANQARFGCEAFRDFEQFLGSQIADAFTAQRLSVVGGRQQSPNKFHRGLSGKEKRAQGQVREAK